MNIIMGVILIAFSLFMIASSHWKGYVPVSFPKYRVYRAQQPVYFWTLIAGYTLVCAVRPLCHY